MRRRPARLVRTLVLLVLFLLAALAGTASGVLFASMDDLPQIAALDDYSLGTSTRVLGADGSVVAEFTSEGSRRRIVTFEQIPDVLRAAILSSEDADFYHHGGLSLKRIAITAAKRVLGLQKYGGASTITQQLARDLFLSKDEWPWERKLKEMRLAILIEKRYTKNEIFTLFCNKMYWGDHAYGVEAVSQLLFAKHVEDLDLDEAALIAGMLQLNVKQSPYHNYDAAVARRNTVLGRMAAEGYITAADADAARKRPIVTHGQLRRDPSIAPYFKESLRVYLEDRYGQKAIDTGGMIVQTGLDPALQRAANAALDAQLRVLDKMHGYRPPAAKDNIEKAGKSLDTYANEQWTHDPIAGEIVAALVMTVDRRVIHVRVRGWRGTIDPEGYAWTRRSASAAARRGDVVEVRIDRVDAKGTTFTAALDQEPTLEGAVVAVDNRTGEIRAMIGGQHFSSNDMFNRALLAHRQVGSLFKPFVFTAAIDSGMTAGDTIVDEPTDFLLPGEDQPLYAPRNYEGTYGGVMTLRAVLEQSENVPTVKLMDLLTPEKVIPYARALGITTPIPPFLSTAIGSAEGTLMEYVSAYAAFPNQGIRMAPLMVDRVTDRDGKVLEENFPEPHEGIRADTAAIITSLLHGVVTEGTAHARSGDIDWPLGGKTGTTDDFTDAWFIGFDPDLTVGVWVGYNAKKTIGEKMSGANAALPIWDSIMRSWIERRRAELPQRPAFPRPSNVVDYVMPNGRTEIFIAGTAPGKPVVGK